MSTEYPLSTLDGECDQILGFKVPVHGSSGGDTVLFEASGWSAQCAAHADRFRRPSLSLLALSQGEPFVTSNS